jgi:glycosyltransferase involved in cell wall biosynthesis
MEPKNKLSILIPSYNEERTIIEVLNKIFSSTLTDDITKEVIIVDDGSTDQTSILLTNYISKNKELPLQVYRHKKNSGKGASVRLAVTKANGNIFVIQDADLEYDPAEYNKMLAPIIAGHADVVYGSRFMGEGPHRALFFSHTLANKLLTSLSNVLTGLNLTDMETGYKMFNAEIIKKIDLREKRFGFEPEITAKISRIPNIRIYEVGIAYYGRTYSEGKKIGWKDGIKAFWCIIKYNVFR